jgi:hypothetical protein
MAVSHLLPKTGQPHCYQHDFDIKGFQVRRLIYRDAGIAGFQRAPEADTPTTNFVAGELRTPATLFAVS